MISCPSGTSPRRVIDSAFTSTGKLTLVKVVSGMYQRDIDFRIPIADIPEDDDGIKTWLESRWEAKDRLLSSWIEGRKGRSDRVSTGSSAKADKRRQSVSLTVHSERDPGVKAKQQVVEVQSGRVKAE